MSVTGAIMAGVGAAGSLGGAAIASSGAKSAANTQAQSADYAAQLQSQDAQKALDFQKQVYGNQQSELAPYYQSGTSALANLDSLLGILSPQTASTNVPTPGAPTSASTGVPNAIPYEGNSNVPQYIPGPHGSDMPNPAYGAQQRRSTITAAPSGTSRLDTLGQLVNPSLGAPGSLSKGWDQTFQSPTNVTEQNDPGYQFRLQTGLNAIQNSAAARGGALTQGTAQDLNNYAQGDASNEYQNVYNRALQNYDTNFNTFQTNQANQYNRLAALAGVGQTATQQLGSSGTAAAGNTANILLNSGQQVGNSIQNAGNARATGYANTGNIFGNAMSGIGGNLSNLLMMNQLLNNGGGGMNSVPSLPDYNSLPAGALG